MDACTVPQASLPTKAVQPSVTTARLGVTVIGRQKRGEGLVTSVLGSVPRDTTETRLEQDLGCAQGPALKDLTAVQGLQNASFVLRVGMVLLSEAEL